MIRASLAGAVVSVLADALLAVVFWRQGNDLGSLLAAAGGCYAAALLLALWSLRALLRGPRPPRRPWRWLRRAVL